MNRVEAIKLIGIVDKLRVVRYNKEAQYFVAAVRIEYPDVLSQYSKEPVSYDLDVVLPLDSDVNPGDVVSVDIFAQKPSAPRFQPALEASTSDDDDVLDVMVEDGMKEEG